MVRNARLPAALLALALGFVPTVADAHGIWIAPRHGDYAIVYGHGGSDEGYDPAKVVALEALGDGAAAIERIVGDDHVLFAAPDAPVVTATMDNGFWSKTADGPLIV